MPIYYSGWSEEILDCTSCGWEGTAAKCRRDEMFDKFFDLYCSNCQEMITRFIYSANSRILTNFESGGNEFSACQSLLSLIEMEENSEARNKAQSNRKYKVMVDDNYYFMDETERYALGEYETWEEAVNAAKKIVDDFLISHYKPGMTANKLYDYYESFGEDSFIVNDNRKYKFSAWNYAEQRCQEICGRQLFDENRYKHIKIMLEEALSFYSPTTDPKEGINNIFDFLAKKITPKKIREMESYIVRFMEERFDGKFDYDKFYE